MTGSPLRMVQDAIPRPEVWPHSYESEQALLGAVLTSNEVYDQVADILAPRHFADALHGRIFEAIGTIINGGQRANVLTLARQFDQDPALTTLGGAKYLAAMASSAVTLIGCDGYARAIVDLWQRREAMAAAHEMMCRAMDGSVDVTAKGIIEGLEARLGEITAGADLSRDAVTVDEAVDEALRDTEATMQAGTSITGVSTGLVDLDRRLGGLRQGNLIVLAGRPSMGKSALATNIARAVAGRPHLDERAPVYFASLEMSRGELARRWLAEMTGISTERQSRGDLDDEAFTRLIDAGRETAGWPLIVDDSARTVAAIRSRARRMKRRYGSLGLIVVDYLQLLQAEYARRQDNRVNEITAITMGLKAMAKELDAPVLALSQLSRQVEAREDKRPMLSDLRESGSIEQDADVVMFVYREEYYLDRREPKEGSDAHDRWLGLKNDARGKGDIIVGKARMGRIGTVQAHWNGEAGRWGDLAHHQQSMDI